MVTLFKRISRPLLLIAIEGFFSLALVVLYYQTLIQQGIGSHLLDTFDQRSFIYVFEWFNHIILGDGSVSNLISPNFFYPHQKTLTWSDLLFGFIPLYLPLRVITGNPIAALNLVAMGLTFFAALGMMRLGRLVTGKTSFLAPIVGACGLVVAGQEGHLQMKSIAIVIWIFWALIKFALERCNCWMVIAILLWGFLFQCSVYLSLMVLYLVPFCILYLIASRSISLAKLFELVKTLVKSPSIIVTALFVILTTGTTAILYLHGQSVHAAFGAGEFVTYSGRLLSFFDPPSSSLIFHHRYSDWGSHEAKLMLGLISLFLVLVGICSTSATGIQRVLKQTIFVLAALAAIFALGPFQKDLYLTGIHLPLPGWLMWKFVPGFQAMRVAGRFSMVYAIASGVLAELGFTAILSACNKVKFARFCLVISAIGLVYFENKVARTPQKIELIESPEFYKKIATLTPKDASIVELPLTLKDHISSMDNFIAQELASTLHWRRLLIGYSSVTSPELQNALGLWGGYYSGSNNGEELLNYFAKIGLTHIVVDRSRLSEILYQHFLSWLASHGQSTPMTTIDNKELWKIPSAVIN